MAEIDPGKAETFYARHLRASRRAKRREAWLAAVRKLVTPALWVAGCLMTSVLIAGVAYIGPRIYDRVRQDEAMLREWRAAHTEATPPKGIEHFAVSPEQLVSAQQRDRPQTPSFPVLSEPLRPEQKPERYIGDEWKQAAQIYVDGHRVSSANPPRHRHIQ